MRLAEGTPLKLCIIAILVMAIVSQPGVPRAADIFVGGMRWTGIPAIWIRGQIEKGAPLKGLYPPTEEVFARWRKERG